MNIIGYFHGIDPAAGLIRDGQLVAFVEEERLIRHKHAPGAFPIRAIDFCLTRAGLTLGEIDFFAYGWDAPRWGNGQMAAFYGEVYGLNPFDRIQSSIGDEPIDEIMLGTTDAHTDGVILLKYTERKPPENGEIILGFLTDDLEGVYERVLAAGGGIHAPIKDEPDTPYKVGFVKDPEGHLAEVVQML